VTCDSDSPTVTAHDHRRPAVPDAVRTQREPARRKPSIIEAALGDWRLWLIPVDVGVTKPEAELLVEPVGRDPGGPGGQVDAPSPLRLRLVDCRHGQGGADALAAGVLVDDDILDSCPEPGGEWEGDQSQHADDEALAAGDEQGDGLVAGDPDQVVGTA
jgi:hypothetical protein